MSQPTNTPDKSRCFDQETKAYCCESCGHRDSKGGGANIIWNEKLQKFICHYCREEISTAPVSGQ